MKSILLAIFLLAVIFSNCSVWASKVITYPVPDDSGEHCPFDISISGTKVPIEQIGVNNPVYYARFQFSNPVRASLKAKKTGIVDGYLKPVKYRKNVLIENGILSFDIEEPGVRMVRTWVNGEAQPMVFIVAERIETNPPKQTEPGFIDIQKRGVKPGAAVQTAAIQKILDECSSFPGGGVVFFPPGVYRTGTLRIGPNTTLYLSAGTVIKASNNPKDFPSTNSWEESDGEGVRHSFSRLIYMHKADNSKICGYGVIEGNGHVLRNVHDRRVQILDIEQSKNVVVENVVLRNSASWTCHILFCDNVEIKNVKIFGDWDVGNTDGIDPDSSRNVKIIDYFGYCGDDAIAIKCTNNSGLLQSCENITVKNALVVTRKTAFKLGTESRADIKHVLFENCEAIESSRGIGLWMRDGGTFEDVVFKDVELDLYEIKNEGWSGEPYRVVVEERHGLGKIRNVVFERVKASAPFRSVFIGHEKSFIEDLKFVDCEWVIKPREDKMVLSPANVFDRARNISFLGTTRVKWQNRPADLFNGFLGLSRVENFSIGNVENIWPKEAVP